MWCNTSIVIGSEAQFARLESFLPTSNNRNIAFSTNPTRANRTTLSLRYSRVLVHDVHLRALDDLIRSGQDCAFIFEDDVVPAPRTTHDRLRDLMSRLPPNWSYLNLGRCFALCAREQCFAPGIVRHDRSMCRHAYAIRSEAARSLLEHTRSLSKPGDITWSHFLGKHRDDTTFSTAARWYEQDRTSYKSRNGRRDNLRVCEGRSESTCGSSEGEPTHS